MIKLKAEELEFSHIDNLFDGENVVFKINKELEGFKYPFLYVKYEYGQLKNVHVHCPYTEKDCYEVEV